MSNQKVASESLSWIRKLTKGFASTSLKLKEGITDIISSRRLDDGVREELEDLLIRSDIGVAVAQKIVEELLTKRYAKDVSVQRVLYDVSELIHKMLMPLSKPFNWDFSHRPHVILVVGVNGVGKTTVIGKLSKKMSDAGLKVMLAAGDTFRSAAIDQLKIWADRTSADFVCSEIGSDAAALAYEAFKQAQAKKVDVLIIDTAGRLHNNSILMAGIGKMIRVLKRLDPHAPHSVLQVLDATTGQNALRQVEMFHAVAGTTGLIMTKMDGTARGGGLIPIVVTHKIPVYFLGVGEGINDLEPFVAKDFSAVITGCLDYGEEKI
ncbi:signal recognition particle-docking protein FtsY [Candidatus Liberibacter asiaticus]|uniref:Signal recognition particle receptor FtsY n=2 Tax=Liberibacter asiaticus TaxID=34021 RepID=C6XFM9_LIBAP|nr:signal recognition particle-docking protein FtsY [Candidatus Liberibacter asiaticus]ACT57182.1 cell division protein [Candidatus Liberibacter asiaticus str. psy62]AGH16855.1 cell division protein [Candidatus Liberibacter asiaticus str. gxpsy]ASK52694.1 signal recognition particle-docking protein FtsY [Candidatus Liberibacter asiaticus]AWL14019.1 signal recognition particle-docking protein FtsY [Candidatus Liberibacter asiaticus]KAE9510179.1 Signal recognition particle receptor FtsY [Candida